MPFNERERNDHAPKRATESDFEFLDRCAWPATQNVRKLIGECFDNYPDAEQAELAARLRSGDDKAFRSGLFELFLHEYLRRKGFALTPHPQLPGGVAARPDFLVACPDGSRLYLEAVSASDRDGRNQPGELRIAATLQHLNDATHANFFVEVESAGHPTTQPSGRRLTASVLAWLDGLDADHALGLMEKQEFDRLPTMKWAHEDWEVTITALPCRVDARGRERRLIGVQNFGARMIDGWTPIRDAVMNKARKYGDLDLPLVVAVNVDSHRLDVIDEVQALFGQERYVLDRNSASTEPRMERAGNGAWIGPAGARSRRCSGAWLFHDVNPYTVSRRRHTLYANPLAHLPIPHALLMSVPGAVIVNDRIQRHVGESMGTVFDLPDTWPD